MTPYAYVAIENDRDWVEVAPTLRQLIDLLRAIHPNPDNISFTVIAYAVLNGELQKQRVVSTQWQAEHDYWLDSNDVPLHWWNAPLPE